MKYRILIAIFALFLILPFLALAWGFNKNLGNEPITSFYAAVDKVLAGDIDGFSAVSDSILDRSKLTRAAISTKNRLMFSGFGIVDGADIVSGKDGWLFYKPQFYGANCSLNYDDRYVAAAN